MTKSPEVLPRNTAILRDITWTNSNYANAPFVCWVYCNSPLVRSCSQWLIYPCNSLLVSSPRTFTLIKNLDIISFKLFWPHPLISRNFLCESLALILYFIFCSDLTRQIINYLVNAAIKVPFKTLGNFILFQVSSEFSNVSLDFSFNFHGFFVQSIKHTI